MAVKNVAVEGTRILQAAMAKVENEQLGKIAFIDPTPLINTLDSKGVAHTRAEIVNTMFRSNEKGETLVLLIDSPNAVVVTPVRYETYSSTSSGLAINVEESKAELFFDTIAEWHKLNNRKMPKDTTALREKIKNGGTFVLLNNLDMLDVYKNAVPFHKVGFTDWKRFDSSTIDTSYIDLEEVIIDQTAKVAKKNLLSAIAGYQVPAQIRNFVTNVVPQVFNKGRILNVKLTGPSGAGKTSLPQALGAYYDKPVVMVNCQLQTNPRQWFGKMHMKDGDTFYVKSHFAKMIEKGDCIVILDEINRVSPDDANSLMTLLDHNRQVHLEDVDVTITCGKGVIFFATLNEGSGYTGTSRIDEALDNRFPMVFKFGALTRNQEKALLKHTFSEYESYELSTVDTLLDMFAEIRKFVKKESISIDISTRPLLAIAEQIFIYELPIAEAMMFGIVNKFKMPELEKTVKETVSRYTMASLTEFATAEE